MKGLDKEKRRLLITKRCQPFSMSNIIIRTIPLHWRALNKCEYLNTFIYLIKEDVEYYPLELIKVNKIYYTAGKHCVIEKFGFNLSMREILIY